MLYSSVLFAPSKLVFFCYSFFVQKIFVSGYGNQPVFVRFAKQPVEVPNRAANIIVVIADILSESLDIVFMALNNLDLFFYTDDAKWQTIGNTQCAGGLVKCFGRGPQGVKRLRHFCHQRPCIKRRYGAKLTDLFINLRIKP